MWRQLAAAARSIALVLISGCGVAAQWHANVALGVTAIQLAAFNALQRM